MGGGSSLEGNNESTVEAETKSNMEHGYWSTVRPRTLGKNRAEQSKGTLPNTQMESKLAYKSTNFQKRNIETPTLEFPSCFRKSTQNSE